ncbi:hypothetical protein N656DRAFT_384968 [Canariomyces notabilis]|uniref:Uncharacterized protein n=1 Tax=Canariomyces notabilis TaxID=2074819 RepID=A0AAN6YVH0_9PEZI|nr:hypothetical protein N656DRAFT_384968 [Canariomyces arenarius]
MIRAAQSCGLACFIQRRRVCQHRIGLQGIRVRKEEIEAVVRRMISEVSENCEAVLVWRRRRMVRGLGKSVTCSQPSNILTGEFWNTEQRAIHDRLAMMLLPGNNPDPWCGRRNSAGLTASSSAQMSGEATLAGLNYVMPVLIIQGGVAFVLRRARAAPRESSLLVIFLVAKRMSRQATSDKDCMKWAGVGQVPGLHRRRPCRASRRLHFQIHRRLRLH